MSNRTESEIVIPREVHSPAAEAAFEASYTEVEKALTDLFALFEHENMLLQAGQRRQLAGLQEHKEHLTTAFRERMGELLQRPQYLQGGGNSRREVLSHRIKGLQRLMADNRVLLNAAKVATFRRIEAAVEVRRRQMECDQRYGSDGGRDTDLPIRVPSAISDRKI